MLTDNEIRELIEDGRLAIESVENIDEQIRSVGIDLRAGEDYLHVETNRVINAGRSGSSIVFEPGEFYNIHTIEQVNLPEDVVGHLRPRASLSKEGLSLTLGSNVHPGFEGVLEFGVYNMLQEKTVEIPVGHPVVQLSFEKLDEVPEETYNEREDARYQGQKGLTGPSSHL